MAGSVPAPVMNEAERASRNRAQAEFLTTVREFGKPLEHMSKEVALLRQKLR